MVNLVKYNKISCFLGNMKLKRYLKLMVIIVAFIMSMLMISIISYGESTAPSVKSNTMIDEGAKSPVMSEDSAYMLENIYMDKSSLIEQKEAYDSSIICEEAEKATEGNPEDLKEEISKRSKRGSLFSLYPQEAFDLGYYAEYLEYFKALAYDCTINRNIEVAQKLTSDLDNAIFVKDLLAKLSRDKNSQREPLETNTNRIPEKSKPQNRNPVKAIFNNGMLLKKANGSGYTGNLNSAYQKNSNIRVISHSCAVFCAVQKQMNWIVREETLF